MFIALALALCSSAALAQEQPAPQPAQPQKDEASMTREERIKAHRAKIEKIIEANKAKKAQEAERLKQQAQGTQAQGQQPPVAPGATAQPGAVPPGQPGGPVVSAQPIQPVQPGQPMPGNPAPPGQQASAVPQGARSESRSIFFLYPFDTTVRIGETFVTEVAADTKTGRVDRVQFALQYPKDVLNPLAIDHSPLAAIADEEIEFDYNEEKGEILVAANLARPTNLAGRPLVNITWEALAPTPSSSIRFVSKNDFETGLFVGDTNVLGTSQGAGDGVLNSTIMVRNTKRTTVVQDAGPKGLIISPREMAAPEPSISLSLRPSRNTVRAGEEFHVDLVLSNPKRIPFDRLSAYLQFDPGALEVVDQDRGNSVRSGINVHDGFALERFPFDFYRANEADNRAGVIEYEAGAEANEINASGVVGRIHFRALQDVDRTDIVLVRNKPGYAPTTEVSYLDRSVLAHAPSELTALDGVAVTVEPGNGMSMASDVAQDNGRKTKSGRGVSLISGGLGRERNQLN